MSVVSELYYKYIQVQLVYQRGRGGQCNLSEKTDSIVCSTETSYVPICPLQFPTSKTRATFFLFTLQRCMRSSGKISIVLVLIFLLDCCLFGCSSSFYCCYSLKKKSFWFFFFEISIERNVVDWQTSFFFCIKVFKFSNFQHVYCIFSISPCFCRHCCYIPNNWSHSNSLPICSIFISQIVWVK